MNDAAPNQCEMCIFVLSVFLPVLIAHVLAHACVQSRCGEVLILPCQSTTCEEKRLNEPKKTHTLRYTLIENKKVVTCEWCVCQQSHV